MPSEHTTMIAENNFNAAATAAISECYYCSCDQYTLLLQLRSVGPIVLCDLT